MAFKLRCLGHALSGITDFYSICGVNIPQVEHIDKILPRCWQDPAKIVARSCQDLTIIWQDLAKMLVRSCQDPAKTLAGSWQDLGRILQDLTKILPRGSTYLGDFPSDQTSSIFYCYPDIQSKKLPILFFANKMDLPSALSAVKVSNQPGELNPRLHLFLSLRPWPNGTYSTLQKRVWRSHFCWSAFIAMVK